MSRTVSKKYLLALEYLAGQPEGVLVDLDTWDAFAKLAAALKTSKTSLQRIMGNCQHLGYHEHDAQAGQGTSGIWITDQGREFLLQQESALTPSPPPRPALPPAPHLIPARPL